MSDCLFCKIIAGEIPADVVYENDKVLAFRDINAQAPTHVLVIPKVHIATIEDIQPEQASIMGDLFLAAQAVAKVDGLSEAGYRTVMNCQEGAGQSVFHIHLHVIGGRPLSWPPG
ncbi:histidine triad protein [gamma proteobacterium HTCC5015]|nr:histidine triad protein [gamma proteobacterium HTCC5015]